MRAFPIRCALFGCVILVLTALAVPLPAGARPAPDSFADLADKLLPTVVNISTSQTLKALPQGTLPELPPGSPLEDLFKNFLGPRSSAPRHVTSLGSGFVIDPTGAVSDGNVTETSLNNNTTESCMLSRIRRWKFPEPQGGGIVTVTFPWIFKPAGAADEE